MATAKTLHGFTRDWREWCPCGPFPLVELGADGNGPVEVPMWFVRLPCEQERALRRLAKASRLSRAEVLARILAVALRGGEA